MTRFYIEFGAGVIVATVLLWVGWHFGTRHIQLRWDEAKAVQATRDTDAALAYAKATKAAKDAQDAATDANRRIENELLPQLDGANTRAAALTRLLYAARQGQPSGGPVPKGSDQPGTAPASGGTASGSQLEEATAAVFAACERDGSRLDALIGEIKPQL